ncbi:MAG TPA: HAMP domain-containing sensor histidine kinase [Bacillota bacterium]|nr:HAMP domain-containing sensor histidine kinase [Bacillota bacterium]
MKNQKMGKGVQIVLGIALVLISFTGCFTAAFFLTSFIYKNTGWGLPDFLVQLINSGLGLLLAIVGAGLIISIRVKYAKPKLGGIFETIINAIEKIAGGDFNVRLDPHPEGGGPFGELVKSVNHMAEGLGQIEKMRQEFIANVSHEIQSPLTSIRGFAKVLKNDQLAPEERLRYLSIIEAESARLSKLGDNLLKLASLEAETIRLQPKPYRLDKQLQNLILACEPQWMEKEIEMEVFLDEVTINADEEMLSQVWINLIHNSIKFTPDGGRARVDLHVNGAKIECKISDTGIGIAEEDQTRIFERFYKADPSRERSNKGSGLGLAIANKIVEMHRGTIGVESKLGVGTTFTVSLPVR